MMISLVLWMSGSTNVLIYINFWLLSESIILHSYVIVTSRKLEVSHIEFKDLHLVYVKGGALHYVLFLIVGLFFIVELHLKFFFWYRGSCPLLYFCFHIYNGECPSFVVCFFHQGEWVLFYWFLPPYIKGTALFIEFYIEGSHLHLIYRLKFF